MTIREVAAGEGDLVAVSDVGPCPLCAQATIKNDRGGTTCPACAVDSSVDAVMSRRNGEAVTGNDDDAIAERVVRYRRAIAAVMVARKAEWESQRAFDEASETLRNREREVTEARRALLTAAAGEEVSLP